MLSKNKMIINVTDGLKELTDLHTSITINARMRGLNDD